MRILIAELGLALLVTCSSNMINGQQAEAAAKTETYAFQGRPASAWA